MTTTNATAIHTALETFRPQIASGIVARIEANFTAMTKLAADAGEWRNINAWTRPEVQRMWRETTRACCNAVPGPRPWSEPSYTFNPDKAAKLADAHTTAMLATWEAKIVGKLAELTDAEAVRQNGVGFILRGTKAGRVVSIEQHMIVNVSSKGLLFNQFPARIYVDGKFASEAAYKRMFG